MKLFAIYGKLLLNWYQKALILALRSISDKCPIVEGKYLENLTSLFAHVVISCSLFD